MYYSDLETPIGKITIEADDASVCYVGFKEAPADSIPSDLTNEARKQFEQYFNGERLDFSFAISQPGSDFQQGVWKQLLTIPAGFPVSYTALSRKMNNPLAIRAIAAANGKNNLMIVVPCHRVIGANGDLVGYAGGLWRKKWLLEHEAKVTGIGQAALFS